MFQPGLELEPLHLGHLEVQQDASLVATGDAAEKIGRSDVPMVVLATAHPAKFPEAVKSACGIDPALPSWLFDLMDREERYETLPADLDTVEAHILRHTRAAA